MTIKWTEKDVMEHAKALKSPYPQPKPNLGEMVRGLFKRPTGV